MSDETPAGTAPWPPPRPGAPAGSNWGVFGDDDEYGTLNYLTPAAVRAAASCVRDGRVFPLNLPVNLPSGRPIGRPEHAKTAHIRNMSFDGIVVNDDHIVLATQGSSQWDSFVHVGAEEEGQPGVFYNGVGKEAVGEDGYVHRNGIDKIAQRGIAGRGLLLDVARLVAGGASDPLPADHVIDEAELSACLRHQGAEIRPGDIVCLRTGWVEAYLDADEAGRAELMEPVGWTMAPASPGITPDLAPLARHQQWAAVVADNLAVEASPFRPDNARSAHVRMLRNLGLPFGELFLLRDLAAAAAADRRYDFLFVAAPLWIPGGMGSPANAIALR
ncbi:MAG TPA: cyclase family protein [Acidimicrobiia bacterium]|nr:cyclase family protein [Acidimicrobiia bacterium]